MTSRDWATDFDHFDPRYNADPYPVWDELRATCPVAHAGERLRGMWVPTRYEDVVAIAHDVATYSSRSPVVTEVLPMSEMGIVAPPISSDPPYHTDIRRMLLPYFGPKRIEALRPGVEDLCDRLIDGFVEDGRCDAAVDYAQHIPVTIIAEMLGVPADQGERFREWVHVLLEVGPNDLDGGFFGLTEFLTYFREQMLARRAEPGDDIVSYLTGATIDGRPLEDQEVLGVCLLLLLAGIDTTWSSIGSTLLHLATNPEDARRLRAEPELWPLALEEFLGAFAPVTMAREVDVDVELHGCPLRAGDPLLLPFPAANRDPAAFDRPDEVLIDREQNRHVAFGVGIHRCLGSNLARLELQVAVERFLARVPDFAVEDPAGVSWSVGQVRGPRSLPFAFATA